MATRRVVTETHAWCSKGKHMVEHAGFAKGQGICRECRKCYNIVSNYSLGLKCSDCDKPIANTTRTGHCRPCHSAWAKANNIYSRPRRWVSVQGYALLNQHYGHPNANHKGEILEHVKVMSESLGRPLVAGENVHHINGVRDDNRIENLELWVRSQPSGQRPADLVAWAREILSRYELEVGA